MAVAAGTMRRRRNDEEQKVAAKSKRDKVILAVGGALLLAVLVFEVPKVLSSGSSSAPAPAPVAAAAAPAATATGGAPSPEVVRSDLKAIAKLPSKDPFQAQLGANTAVATGMQPLTHGPAVRSSHFVVKNPFKAQIGAPVNAAPAAPLATPPTVTSTKAAHKAAANRPLHVRLHRDPPLARQQGRRAAGGQEGTREGPDQRVDPLLVEVHDAPPRLLGRLPEQVRNGGGCERRAPGRIRTRLRVCLSAAGEKVRTE